MKKIKLTTEQKTIAAMLKIYCHHHHNTGKQLCDECESLYYYASERLEKCPFGSDKPTCQSCTIHCYKLDRREQARIVMRYAGPRILWRHPILAIKHLIKNRKATPQQ